MKSKKFINAMEEEMGNLMGNIVEKDPQKLSEIETLLKKILHEIEAPYTALNLRILIEGMMFTRSKDYRQEFVIPLMFHFINKLKNKKTE